MLDIPAYLHVAHARDLVGADRLLFRALEVLPGFLSWGTLILIVLLSLWTPVVAAYAVIAFDLFWLLKTFYLIWHQHYNWKRLKHNMQLDWRDRIVSLKYEHIHHLVLLPYYQESEQTVIDALESIVQSDYDPSKLLVVLATEARAGDAAQAIARRMEERYGSRFGALLTTIHPDGVAGEIRGKGPNIAYAAKEARDKLLRPKRINYDDVVVSAFDIDTVVSPQYFLCLTWHFLTVEDRHRASFQPVPLYNNNIWDAPAVSRVAAFSSTFWQMIMQERVEKLVTFSSHAMSFKALDDVGYWQKNMISDDSRIFWNMYFAHDGNYRVVPISYPVSMDANLAPSTWQTLKNIYKQHFRWMWGVENIPYMLYGFLKNKKIPRKEKLFHSLVQIEGFWSLATAPFIILLLGWLPLLLGGDTFRDTVLSYNLPYVTQNLMVLSMLGLVIGAMISISLMPKLPSNHPGRRRKYMGAVLQWFLVPITIIVFGAVPGLHAQTRLMVGRYVDAFWVTPKHRKESSPAV